MIFTVLILTLILLICLFALFFREMNIENADERHRVSKNLSSFLEISRKIYRNSDDLEVKVSAQILPVVVSLEVFRLFLWTVKSVYRKVDL